MTGKIGSFGSLAERIAPRTKPTPYCTVDDTHPGLIVEWTRTNQGWAARVAYVTAGVLIAEEVPAARLRAA